MSQSQKNNDFNFFDKVKKRVEKVERQSYKKTIISALLIGLSIGLVWQVFHSINQHYVYKHNIEQQAELNLSQDYAKKIKAISPSEFENFLSYLRQNDAEYQRRFNVIINAYLQSSIQSQRTKEEVQEADKIGTALSHDLTAYQETLIENMGQFRQIYQQAYNGNSFNNEQAQLLLSYYYNYQSKVFSHDKGLDDDISNYGYPDKNGDIHYFNDNQIYKQIQNNPNDVAVH